MVNKLSEKQKEVIGLLHGYSKLESKNVEYFLCYINNQTHFGSSECMFGFNFDGVGYYILRKTPERVTIQTTKLNGNTVNSLLQRKILVSCGYNFSYKLDKSKLKNTNK